MNPLLFLASLGTLTTVFVPASGDAVPSLHLTGTTAPNAVVHAIVDEAETYQQADGEGNFAISVWGLTPGQHAILMQASAKNTGESQKRQYVITMNPAIISIDLPDIDLPIMKQSLDPTLARFDLHKDDAFTVDDILSFIQQYHKGNMQLDFDHDGAVTLKDFSIIMSYFLTIAR